MALELKYDVTENQDRLGVNFTEKTGAYSSGNLGGWGAPNPEISAVIDMIVTITKRGETSSYSTTVSPTLPTTSSDIQYLIPATSFGFDAGEKITDGIYRVAVSATYLTGSGTQGTASDAFYFAFVGGLECCISTIRSGLSVPTGACDCESDAINEASGASVLLESICDLVSCDKLDRAQELIDYLQRYCECNCSECS